MKIVYCINATYNSGGMEKVLCNKANYFADVKGYDVTIITTEQKGRASFFYFSPKIKFIDLGINYDDDKQRHIFVKILNFLRKRRIHHQKLIEILEKEKANICISMFDRDFSILHKIKDGSKKILEFHFCRKMKVLEQRNFLMKIIQSVRVYFWKYTIKKYDKFVVLTEEDRKDWGDINNIEVIPNSINIIPDVCSDLNKKNVISIGRVSYQKGFDMLLKAWSLVVKQHKDWTLTIVGGGEKGELITLVNELGIQDNVILKPATRDIESVFLSGSIYVMSSRYEGLPMVLIEALSYGLPIVSFACPCGPKDVIKDDCGKLVRSNNIKGMADSIIEIIENKEERYNMGYNARKRVKSYMESDIMDNWILIFNSLN